jgi:large subunit ribosomal protein L10
MGIEQKKETVKEIAGMLEGARGVVVADFTGLTVENVSELRRRLRGENVQFRVVKATLARRAVEGSDCEALLPALEGPCGVAVHKEDPTSAARVIEEFIKEFQKGSYRGGMAEGRYVDETGVKALAKIPPRDELIAKLLGTIQGPINGLVWTLNGLVRQLVATLDAVAKQKQES